MTWTAPVLNNIWNSHDVPIAVHYWTDGDKVHVEIVEEGRTMCGLSPDTSDLTGVGSRKRKDITCDSCRQTRQMIEDGATVTFGDQAPDV